MFSALHISGKVYSTRLKIYDVSLKFFTLRVIWIIGFYLSLVLNIVSLMITKPFLNVTICVS